MARSATKEKPEKPKVRASEKAAREFQGVEAEVQNLVAQLVEKVDAIWGKFKAKDCASALEHAAEGARLLRGAGRLLGRASKLDEVLRRQGIRLDPPAVETPLARVCPIDRAECGYAIDGATCTITAALTVPARGGGIGTERIPARYCVVNLSDLHTSHLPLATFAPDPAYPAGAQERDYRLPVEQAKVQQIAENYDAGLIFNTAPGAIDGPPVVNEDRIVLGGNGRTMATALVYAGRSSVEPGTPKTWLVEHAHEFGLDPKAIERFPQPVVVRTIRVANDPKLLAEWSRRLNVSLSQQLDPVRLAVSRARFVDEAVLRELDVLADDETLAAFLATPRSRGFVRALQRSNIIDGRASSLYVVDGLLNDTGRKLAEDLLVAVLVPDADLIAAYGRAAVASLARAAPALVAASQWPEYDLREPLRKAVRDRITMDSQRIVLVADFLAQGGLFAGTSAAVSDDPRATALLYVLAALELAPAKFTRFARRYVELAREGGGGQAALFAAETVTPIQAIKRAAADLGVKVP